MRSTQGKPTNHPARILLLASHQAGLKARKSVLEEQGYEVVPCSKVKDAAAHLANDGISLVVCDYKLDQHNGVEFLQAIRETHATLPSILLLTPVEETQVDPANCGADLLVSKRANEVVQLVRGVQRLLTRKAPRKKPSAIRKTSATPAQARNKA
jgi:DNA-binding response OmpR family regulator